MSAACETLSDLDQAADLARFSGVIEAEVTVIMVSFNTRELTLRAIETLLAEAGSVRLRVIVADNASSDGSADAVAAQVPMVELIRSEENLGFARANNLAAERVTSEYMLLLNPDTETRDRAIERLLAFARAYPEAGIVGGRTVFPDGNLNPSSCANRMTIWSLICSASGLTHLFPHSPVFNSEQIGGWGRDEAMEVDIVIGCFFLIRTSLWRKLEGFDPRYFMYGEETDLCLRARAAGYFPMITPDAEIMHLVGASTPRREDKLVPLMRARATLIRSHWRATAAPIGIGLLWLWAATRRVGSIFLSGERELWRNIWRRRKEWLGGY